MVRQARFWADHVDDLLGRLVLVLDEMISGHSAQAFSRYGRNQTVDTSDVLREVVLRHPS